MKLLKFEVVKIKNILIKEIFKFGINGQQYLNVIYEINERYKSVMKSYNMYMYIFQIQIYICLKKLSGRVYVQSVWIYN